MVSSVNFTGEKKEQTAAAQSAAVTAQNNLEFAETESDADYPF